jgi:hypothetical protein
MDDESSDLEFSAMDRALGGALLIVVLALGYIALDTVAAGALTRTLSRGGDE